MSWWVSLDNTGAVTGLFANQQPGIADVQLDETSAVVCTYLATQTIQELHDTAIAFVQARYADSVMIRFALLLMQAQAAGRTSQQRQCQKVCDWCDSVITAFASAAQQVMQATTIEASQAVSIDFASLGTADPGISLPATLAMTS